MVEARDIRTKDRQSCLTAPLLQERAEELQAGRDSRHVHVITETGTACPRHAGIGGEQGCSARKHGGG